MTPGERGMALRALRILEERLLHKDDIFAARTGIVAAVKIGHQTRVAFRFIGGTVRMEVWTWTSRHHPHVDLIALDRDLKPLANKLLDSL